MPAQCPTGDPAGLGVGRIPERARGLDAGGDDGRGVVVLGDADAASRRCRCGFGIPVQIEHVHQLAALSDFRVADLLQQVTRCSASRRFWSPPGCDGLVTCAGRILQSS